MALAGPPGGAGWTWRPVARDALLARAFHSCTELRGRFYLVGGLRAGGATEPSGDTVVFDPAAGQAVQMGARGGPRRSHHDAAPVAGRWLCVVGGWDGSRRLATVAALDTERGAWEAWSAAPGSRLPAGLSSHTCTRVSDRELRVAGREGGTRTQRRYGSIYTLRLDPGARTYCYKEEGCHTASRSGHCAALLQTAGPHPAHQLLLFGGCNSPEPEVAGHWSQGKIKEEPPAAPRLMEQLARLGRQHLFDRPLHQHASNHAVALAGLIDLLQGVDHQAAAGRQAELRVRPHPTAPVPHKTAWPTPTVCCSPTSSPVLIQLHLQLSCFGCQAPLLLPKAVEASNNLRRRETVKCERRRWARQRLQKQHGRASSWKRSRLQVCDFHL
uniref:Kelch domain-containing protein 9 n=1 Tax=Ursus americanus TaxID=9643 RepID=A0A452SLF2_URSAM